MLGFFETNQEMHKVLLGVPILLKWTSVCICGICISMYMWSLVTLRNSLVHFNVLFLTSRMLFRGFWIQCKAFHYISDSEYDLLKKKSCISQFADSQQNTSTRFYLHTLPESGYLRSLMKTSISSHCIPKALGLLEISCAQEHYQYVFSICLKWRRQSL